MAMPQALDNEGAVGVEQETLIKNSAEVEEGRGLSDGWVVRGSSKKDDGIVQDGGARAVRCRRPHGPRGPQRLCHSYWLVLKPSTEVPQSSAKESLA